MNCPWCVFESPPRPLHAHLAEAHIEKVQLHERDGKRFYRIACPLCEEYHEQQVKPRGKDPNFLEEFKVQIALVGFDMLINHLMAEHDALNIEGGGSDGSQ